jgi:hypothetical protein
VTGKDERMRFDRYEAPVAYAMMDLVATLPPTLDSPFTAFSCCWMAFNSIYGRLGPAVTLKTDPAGAILTEPVAHVARMPRVNPVTERHQINAAVAALDPGLIHALITHRSTRFFVVRVPRWKQTRIRRDAFGQRLNGVLKVSRTVCHYYPVWSPSDPAAYKAYMAGSRAPVNELTEQIVEILYAVRNNTFHGGKMPRDANDRRVVEKAYPLLHMIVKSFML